MSSTTEKCFGADRTEDKVVSNIMTVRREEKFYVDSLLPDLWEEAIQVLHLVEGVQFFYAVTYLEAQHIALQVLKYMLLEDLVDVSSYYDPLSLRSVQEVMDAIEGEALEVTSLEEFLEKTTTLWITIKYPQFVQSAAKRTSILGGQQNEIRPEVKPSEIIKGEMKHLRSLLTDEYLSDSEQYLKGNDHEWIKRLQSRKLITFKKTSNL